jgi:hypothetical protein
MDIFLFYLVLVIDEEGESAPMAIAFRVNLNPVIGIYLFLVLLLSQFYRKYVTNH